MPTKRRRKSRSRIADVSPDVWALLVDCAPENPFEKFAHSRAEMRELWVLCRGQILSEWIATKGGTRPSHWWKFDAPRLADIPERFARCEFASVMIEPRRLLGGAGRPAWEELSIVPSYRHGVPASWVGWDDDSPPVFETQFDYLRRHGLLESGEIHVTEGPPPELQHLIQPAP